MGKWQTSIKSTVYVTLYIVVLLLLLMLIRASSPDTYEPGTNSNYQATFEIESR